MTTYIALLRGINVGGHATVPMKTLADVLTREGFADVRTYIQSGNVVFASGSTPPAALPAAMTRAIERALGVRPGVIVLAACDFDRIVAANPFPKAAAHPQFLHVTFMAAPPKRPDLKALDALRADTERFALKGQAFYLHAPDGIGRSKLAARIEKALGVAGTSRNWRTVLQLQAMARTRR